MIIKNKIKYFFFGSVFLIGLSSYHIFYGSQEIISKNKEAINTIVVPTKINKKIELVDQSKIQKKIENLRQLERQVLKSVPEPKFLLAQSHRPHIALAALASTLGELRESWQNEPELYDEALEFYQKCVSNPKLIMAMRALCMQNVELLSTRMNKQIERPDVEDADEIINLLEELNKT